jgi:hypothetical protein
MGLYIYWSSIFFHYSSYLHDVSDVEPGPQQSCRDYFDFDPRIRLSEAKVNDEETNNKRLERTSNASVLYGSGAPGVRACEVIMSGLGLKEGGLEFQSQPPIFMTVRVSYP